MSASLGLELRRRLRETGGRGRKLRGLGELLAPYRWRVILMFTSLVLATAAVLAPAPLAKIAIDNGIRHHNVATLDLVVLAFLASAIVYALATWAQTYLVGWVGQRALQDLRVKLFVHLQSLSISFYSRNRAGRGDLEDDQRCRGTRPTRGGRPGHADPVQPDPDRRGGASCSCSTSISPC